MEELHPSALDDLGRVLPQEPLRQDATKNQPTHSPDVVAIRTGVRMSLFNYTAPVSALKSPNGLPLGAPPLVMGLRLLAKQLGLDWKNAHAETEMELAIQLETDTRGLIEKAMQAFSTYEAKKLAGLRMRDIATLVDPVDPPVTTYAQVIGRVDTDAVRHAAAKARKVAAQAKTEQPKATTRGVDPLELARRMKQCFANHRRQNRF